MSETPYAATKEIATLTDYISVVQDAQCAWEAEGVDYYPRNLWFRGQTKDWALLPKVLRVVNDPDTGNKTRYNELGILTAFAALHGNYVADSFEPHSVEMLAFMQHNGIPTRLLDWTESALMGLYFAVAQVHHCTQASPVVWIMAPGELNHLALEGLVDSSGPFLDSIPLVQARVKAIGFYNPEADMRMFYEKHPEMRSIHQERLLYPLAFYPTSRHNIRLATQKGCFTIHGLEPVSIEQFFLGKAGSECFLRKVQIRQDAAARLREELRVMGITSRSVFPDLTGLSQELNGQEYLLKPAPNHTVIKTTTD